MFLSQQEANSLQRPFTICGNWPIQAREHLASRGRLPAALLLPPRLSTLCFPCPLQQCPLYAPRSLGTAAPITDPGSSFTALTSPACVLTFWLPLPLCLQVCLSIVEADDLTPRGPANAPPLSLCRIQAAAM